jgi:hypothetical protein
VVSKQLGLIVTTVEGNCLLPATDCLLLFKEDSMPDYESNAKQQGQLMTALLEQKSKFSTEEEFKEFAIAEVRRFIGDLRSINIEITMRPAFSKNSLSRPSVTEKLNSPRENQ